MHIEKYAGSFTGQRIKAGLYTLLTEFCKFSQLAEFLLTVKTTSISSVNP